MRGLMPLAPNPQFRGVKIEGADFTGGRCVLEVSEVATNGSVLLRLQVMRHPKPFFHVVCHPSR
jgi:hypothetical protein